MTRNKRLCKNCGYLNNEYKPTCYNWSGPRRNEPIIKPDSETCDEHEFEDEKHATSLLGSSVDCAKYAIGRLSKEALTIALERENAGSKRRSLLKMIEVQLRKLEKAAKRQKLERLEREMGK